MYAPIIEIGWQARRFILFLMRDLFLLPFDIALVFGVNFDFLGDLRISDRRPSPRQRHQPGIRDPRTPQQVLQRVFVCNALAQYALAFVRRKHFWIDPTRSEPLKLAYYRFAFAFELPPTQVIDHA